MDVGQTFREGFEHMVNEMGDTILIHKNYGSTAQSTIEVRGLKNSARGADMFQFLEDPGVVVGDVLGLKNSRDLWRVTEVHDDVIGDVYQHFEARVKNMGAAPSPVRATVGHRITVNGPVHGGIQVDSPGAVQHNTVQVSHIQNDIRQLRELFAASPLSALDKEEAALTLSRIDELAAKPKSPDLLAKIGKKVEELKTLAASTAVLATTASPLIFDLWNKIQAS
jgi:hypothetical protein